MVEKILLGSDTIHLKKDIGGWRIIYPLKNDDGTLNMKNLLIGGNYINFAKTIFVLLCLLLLTWSYAHDMKQCSEIANYAVTNPCEWCEIITKARLADNNFYNSTINFSSLIPIT